VPWGVVVVNIRVRNIARRSALWAAALALGGGVATVVAPATAQAAVPNAWAFALVSSPLGPVSASHSAESRPAPVPTAAPAGPGVEVVRFRNIGFFKGGTVHVTAVTDQLAWCQAQGWRTLGGSEFVTVRCFVKGVASFVPFTVMYSQSSGRLPGGLSYAYVSHGTTSGSSYNSTGHANTVTALGLGRWRVRLLGAGPATPSGGVQLTAVGTAARICDIVGRAQTLTAQFVTVACYTKAGVPAASGWTLTYQRGRAITGTRPTRFAYTVNNKPTFPGTYVPAPPGVNFNSTGAINTVGGGSPEALVRFPKVGVLPNIVFVTPAATRPRVCNLNTTWFTQIGPPRAVIVRDVICYTPTGAFTRAASFITYASSR
jgi:hypothetical protein